MRYMILIYNDPTILDNMTQAEQEADFQSYMAFNQVAAEKNVMRNALPLHPASTATTLRVRDGKSNTFDGPFAETKEILGGVYVLDCKDLDEALELAALIPAAHHSSVEIRPILEIPGVEQSQ